MPPPKVSASALARAIVGGLVDGLEEVPVGDIARDVFDRWQENALLLEREMKGNSG